MLGDDQRLNPLSEEIHRHREMLRINRIQNPVPGLEHLTVACGDLSPVTINFGPKRCRLPRAGDKVRVGAFTPIVYPGGAEAMFISLARGTKDRLDWRGCVVLGDHPDDPATGAAIAALMPLRHGREAAIELAAEVDVLLTYAINGLPEILSRVENPPKVISTIHAPLGDPWGDRVYAQHTGIDQWVAVSELALEALPPASREAAPATVIWNAVDLDRLQIHRSREQMRALWGVPLDAPVAGFYQRLSPEKDPLAALRLAASLPDDWHVVVVGRGPLGDELRRAGRPRLHVFDADPASGDVLNAFSVLCVLSRYESFGLTLGEGLMLGIPEVTTRVGLAKLQPGLTRLVSDLAEGQELAAAVLEAYRAGPMPGSQEFARTRLAPARFEREWARLIEKVAEPPDRNHPDLIRQRADLCEHGSGPCGCGAKPRLCDLYGEVRRSDCLRCKTEGESFGASFFYDLA